MLERPTLGFDMVSSNTDWEPSATIELVALVLTLPGAVAALATLWALLSRRRQRVKSQCILRIRSE